MMKAIGMIVPTVDNSFFANLSHEIEKEMFRHGYFTYICDSGNNAEKEKDYFRILQESGCAGIICVSGLSSLPAETAGNEFPLVFVDRVPESERVVPWVANDDAAAMEEAVTYLIAKGCRNIALMAGYTAEQQESPRVRGYKRALEANGITVRNDLILNRPGKKSSEEETEEMVQDLMHKGFKIDGIITSSDRAAFGAMTALKKTGYYVPEDVRLISFDNSPYSSMSSPSVTAIDRNPAMLAQKACDVLLKIITGEEAKTENIINVSLVKRDSTR